MDIHSRALTVHVQELFSPEAEKKSVVAFMSHRRNPEATRINVELVPDTVVDITQPNSSSSAELGDNQRDGAGSRDTRRNITGDDHWHAFKAINKLRDCVASEHFYLLKEPAPRKNASDIKQVAAEF
ncbi:hypothetical protein QFC21_005810 [Naganishia friedmannii]|uniref:Uncharacterized protein n=1 Tax=Naganishia friedmannii TaxID=89922 RepID=A0ACC2V6V7_9TREE|nr:hypothetical protein QFC21_005810 [Naganishia friedmannii]